MKNFDLIFDNGGGITLQTDDYCHHFNGRECEAAEAVGDLLAPGDPDSKTWGWEGNEPEHRVTYDAETEGNGGYRWVTDNDVYEAVGQIPEEDREDFLDDRPGAAEREFFEHLFAIRDHLAQQQ